MRIVFVLPHAGLAGGIRVVATYARLLKARGHDVFVVSTPPRAPGLKARLRSMMRGRPPWSRTEQGPSHFDGVDVTHHRLERFRPVTDADVPDADVVVATWFETAEWVWRLSAQKGAKVYFIQHYEDWSGEVTRLDETWRLPVHKIVISRWLENLGRNRFGITNLSLVPNGVDLLLFDAPPRFQQSIPTVGFVYADARWKGCDVVREAVERARRSLGPLCVKAFGSEWPRAGELPPSTEFTYRPDPARLRSIYASCDAWLFASRTEGFGLPILEAMACRTPVIATPAGAAPELLTAGGGVLLNAPDSQAMATAIERVCGLADGEWRKMSDQARHIAEQHDWDTSTRLFEEALQTAVDARPERRGLRGTGLVARA